MNAQPLHDKAATLAHHTVEAAAARAGLAASMTVYPYVVEAVYRDAAGQPVCLRRVVEAHRAPTGLEDIPADAVAVLRVEVIPVERFCDMPHDRRSHYRGAYAAWARFLQTRAGRQADVIDLDEQVYRWAHPHGNWGGD